MVLFHKRFTAALLIAPSAVLANSHNNGDSPTMKPYVAHIEPVPGSTSTAVQGTIVVVTTTSNTLFYGGFIEGLDANVDAAQGDCDEKNACGVHVHSGFDCANTTLQGGHFFEAETDPWLVERYTSDDTGSATFGAFLDIGTDDVEGRAFLVHAPDGSRIGCGLLQPALDMDTISVWSAETKPLKSDKDTNGHVMVMGKDSDPALCYVGYANGLEADVTSFLEDDSSSMCTAKNGCGTHIHDGTGCVDTDAQGGHWYDADSLPTDPWAQLGYTRTTEEGSAWYGACTATGITASEAQDKPFIVHAVDGSRISCGLLTETSSVAEEEEEAPTQAPSSATGGRKGVVAGALFLSSILLFFSSSV